MLSLYPIGSDQVDSLDLKALVITRGVKVSNEIYKRFGATYRIAPDPAACCTNHLDRPYKLRAG